MSPYLNVEESRINIAVSFENCNDLSYKTLL
jgi:hypothetical protein